MFSGSEASHGVLAALVQCRGHGLLLPQVLTAHSCSSLPDRLDPLSWCPCLFSLFLWWVRAAPLFTVTQDSLVGLVT